MGLDVRSGIAASLAKGKPIGVGATGNECNLKQESCKKTEPDTGGNDPGTEEGAWKKK
jgi:hypothetical protein